MSDRSEEDIAKLDRTHDDARLCLGGPLAGQYISGKGGILNAPVYKIPAPFRPVDASFEDPTPLSIDMFTYRRASLSIWNIGHTNDEFLFWIPADVKDDAYFITSELIRSYMHTESSQDKKHDRHR